MDEVSGYVVKEVELKEPMCYCSGDRVEKWLYNLLCLDLAKITRSVIGCLSSNDC